MKVGLVLPQAEMAGTGAEVVAFCQRIEQLGYSHLLTYEHILGADSTSRPGWPGPYDHRDPFLEPLLLFAHLAPQTTLDFTTGVLVLPQRQTALVAKQIATLEVLAPGRTRLGVGIGWNRVEYDSLGQRFDSRGARLEEQIPLLRRLLTEPVVDFSGRFDIVNRAGISPLPPAPPPIWIGTGSAPAALDRVGRLADGWIPTPDIFPGHGLEEAVLQIRRAAEGAGRASEDIGFEGHVSFAHRDSEKLAQQLSAWQQSGATSVVVNLMRAGAGWPEDHIAMAETAAEVGRAVTIL